MFTTSADEFIQLPPLWFQIAYVDPKGLAAAHGLTQRAVSPDGSGNCRWCFTEINDRHLDITFKNSEVA